MIFVLLPLQHMLVWRDRRVRLDLGRRRGDGSDPNRTWEPDQGRGPVHPAVSLSWGSPSSLTQQLTPPPCPSWQLPLSATCMCFCALFATFPTMCRLIPLTRLHIMVLVAWHAFLTHLPLQHGSLLCWRSSMVYAYLSLPVPSSFDFYYLLPPSSFSVWVGLMAGQTVTRHLAGCFSSVVGFGWVDIPNFTLRFGDWDNMPLPPAAAVVACLHACHSCCCHAAPACMYIPCAAYHLAPLFCAYFHCTLPAHACYLHARHYLYTPLPPCPHLRAFHSLLPLWRC